MAYDFLIVAKGRSGTHMLASYLNSHPEIGCEGEWGKEDKKIPIDQVSGRLRGCIVMYNVMKEIWGWLPRPQVLHLIRNPETNAVSFVRQVLRYRARKLGGTPPGEDFRLEPGELRHWSVRILREQQSVREVLDSHGFQTLTLRYEDLLDDDGVGRVMPAERALQICDFLGVAPLELVCSLVPEFRTGHRGLTC